MANHLGPFSEAPDWREGQEQPVWAVGGQGRLRGVTWLPGELGTLFFFKPQVFGYGESFRTIFRGPRMTWRSRTACTGCRRSRTSSWSNMASGWARNFWCVLTGSDLFWCVLTCSDMIWPVLTCSDCVLTCSNLFWWVLTCSILFCYVLTCSDVFWPVLSCSDLVCHVLMCSDHFWYVLTCSGLFWCVLTCSDVFWPVLMCSCSWPSHQSGASENGPKWFAIPKNLGFKKKSGL